MTNAFSSLRNCFEKWSFHYNCYETVHPYTPYCSHSSLEVGLIVFAEALKLYTPLYLASQLIFRRKIDYESSMETCKSILRSTSFISSNAFFVMLFFCTSQLITGKFYYYIVAYIPAFLGSSMALMIEKPNRRSSLAFYVANVASEALFKMYVDRGYVRYIPNGQVYMFTLSIATIIYLAKKNQFESDPLSFVIKNVVFSDEISKKKKDNYCKNDIEQNPLLYSLKPNDSSIVDETKAYKLATKSSSGTKDKTCKVRLLNLLKPIVLLVTRKHKLCLHESSSCISNAFQSSIKGLLYGYGSQLVFKIVTKIPIFLYSRKSQRQTLTQKLLSICKDKGVIRFGLFLALFNGLFKISNCSLRRYTNSDDHLNSFYASIIAGQTYYLYPSPSLALYVLWKCIEISFHTAARSNKLFRKYKDALIVILYGLSTSQLFYSAVLEPKYIKKSYLAFLDQMSRHRLHWINRNLLDIFGTNASAGYEDFFPDLHPKFLSHQFLSSIWIWLIEQRFPIDKMGG